MVAVAALAGVATAQEEPAPETVRERSAVGRSVEGRAIEAVELGDPDAEVKVLVIGVIHGDEAAGRPVARALEAGPPIPGVDLWVVKELNPDGRARRTRGNARGVDLNRNFPHRWRPLPRGGNYSGRRPLSEPESRAAHRLISRLEPDLTIWYHQPFGLVDMAGGDRALERRYGRLTGLPVRRLPRYPGSATSWQNVRLPRTTAMVVELPARGLDARGVRRHAAAVRELAESLVGP